MITRHFNRKYAEITMSGSFRFGTIEGYRPADQAQLGRFSDYQEGLQREVFHSRTGIYNIKLDDGVLSDNTIIGFSDPVAIEYRVNDYCSCSSIGDFEKERALLLRSRGNPDIDYYVVYDLRKLLSAIDLTISERSDLAHLTAISRKVEYGQKDRHWRIEEQYTHKEDRDHLAVWLGNAFVKSPDYCHEEEVRILLTDLKEAGGLRSEFSEVILKDERIAEAIVASGAF